MKKPRWFVLYVSNSEPKLGFFRSQKARDKFVSGFTTDWDNGDWIDLVGYGQFDFVGIGK